MDGETEVQQANWFAQFCIACPPAEPGIGLKLSYGVMYQTIFSSWSQINNWWDLNIITKAEVRAGKGGSIWNSNICMQK